MSERQEEKEANVGYVIERMVMKGDRQITRSCWATSNVFIHLK